MGENGVKRGRIAVAVADHRSHDRPEKDAARVRITYSDARPQVVLDVNAADVDDLASKGVRQARRGRRPKASA